MSGIDVFQEGDDATYAAVCWLPLAYNYPCDDGQHFTRYNMVVAFRAGMMWANGEDIGVTQSEGGIKEAKAYLCNLLVSFVQEHCDPVPEWAPMPDLMGMLTQIDNAVTITRDIKASSQAEIERLETAATSAICLLSNSSAELDQADPKHFHGQIAEALFLLRAALSGGKP